MSGGGYLFLYRRLAEHWVWREPDTGHAFVSMLMSAAWRPESRVFNGMRFDLEPGQLVVSCREMAARYGWTKDRAYRLLARLAAGSDPEIELVSTRRGTVVAFRKWAELQPVPCDTDRDAGRDTDATPEATPARPRNPDQPGDSGKERDTDATPGATRTATPARRRSRHLPYREEEVQEGKNKEQGDRGFELPESLVALEEDGTLRDLRLAISCTRKTGKIADSVWHGTLTRLGQFPAEIALAAARTYIDQGHHMDGRPENYLIGIARRMAKERGRKLRLVPVEGRGNEAEVSKPEHECFWCGELFDEADALIEHAWSKHPAGAERAKWRKPGTGGS